MINYNIILLFIQIIQIVLVIIFVFLTYGPTKEIVKKQLEKELSKFHSDYLLHNYHLKLVNMNSIESIDNAMLYIKSFPEYFEIIPDAEIITANMFLNFSRKYEFYRKRVLYFICMTVFIMSAISTGLDM